MGAGLVASGRAGGECFELGAVGVDAVEACGLAAVLVHLLELEQLAPEDLERSPLAQKLVASLVRQARPTYRRQVVALAERLQLL